MTLPTQARVVIAGGGIAGCSTAYHLTKLGITDVLLLEQGRLTSGTTWHAAGLVGQMRPNRNMTAMSRYGIELYQSLHAETGLATGWKACGSVNVARTPERMQVLRKQAALASSFGIEVQLITPQEAGGLYPVMRTDDLQGAIWIPGDGKANPADLCMSLAKGARNRGAKLLEGVEVTGVITERVGGVERVAGVLGKPGWLPWVVDEMRATREAVAVCDQTSFGKLLLQGRDALALLQRLCANDVDVAVGRMVYTAMLNRRGGFESDLTVMRLAADRFLLVTGSAQPLRDADWIQRHIGEAFVTLTDVSALYGVLSVMGPRARELLARVSPDDLSPAGLPFGHTKEIDLGHARVRAARMSYVGGPGWELYVPIEMSRHVFLALHEAGADLGLRDAGYHALDALRIEAGRRAWGAELGPDETPFEAGLLAGLKLDKGCDFVGRDALLAARGQPLRKKLVTVVLDDPAAYVWGGETLSFDGQAAGELSSAGWSLRAGACIGLGYVRGDAAQHVHEGTPLLLDLWGEPVTARAWDRWG